MDIQPIFRCAVGMDVHLAVIQVCVICAEPGGEAQVHRHQFGAFQRERRAMAEWIASFSPDTVVMESTGIYWKSPYARKGVRSLRRFPGMIIPSPLMGEGEGGGDLMVGGSSLNCCDNWIFTLPILAFPHQGGRNQNLAHGEGCGYRLFKKLP